MGESFREGQQVRIRVGGRWRPCAGWVGLLTRVPPDPEERYGWSVYFDEPRETRGMTLSYHREDLEQP